MKNLQDKQERYYKCLNLMCRNAHRSFNEMHSTPYEVLSELVAWSKAYNCHKFIDLGAGLGKVCFFMEEFTKMNTYGIENAPALNKLRSQIEAEYPSHQVKWLESDIADVALSSMDMVYFFNSFYEQLVNDGTTVRGKYFNKANFKTYNTALVKKMAEMKKDSLFISYQGFPNETPFLFHLAKTEMDGQLKLWLKK